MPACMLNVPHRTKHTIFRKGQRVSRRTHPHRKVEGACSATQISLVQLTKQQGKNMQNTSSPILLYIQGSRPQVGKAHAPEDPFAAPASSKQPRFQDDNACYSLELSSLAYELGCRPILQTRSIQQKYANVWSLGPRSLRRHSNSAASQFKQWHHMAIPNYNL